MKAENSKLTEPVLTCEIAFLGVSSGISPLGPGISSLMERLAHDTYREKDRSKPSILSADFDCATKITDVGKIRLRYYRGGSALNTFKPVFVSIHNKPILILCIESIGLIKNDIRLFELNEKMKLLKLLPTDLTQKRILAVTQCDRLSNSSYPLLDQAVREFIASHPELNISFSLKCSAKTGFGFDILDKTILDHFISPIYKEKLRDKYSVQRFINIKYSNFFVILYYKSTITSFEEIRKKAAQAGEDKVVSLIDKETSVLTSVHPSILIYLISISNFLLNFPKEIGQLILQYDEDLSPKLPLSDAMKLPVPAKELALSLTKEIFHFPPDRKEQSQNSIIDFHL